MPDATQAVDRFLLDLSWDIVGTPVLTPSITFRHLISGLLTLGSLTHTCHDVFLLTEGGPTSQITGLYSVLFVGSLSLLHALAGERRVEYEGQQVNDSKDAAGVDRKGGYTGER